MRLLSNHVFVGLIAALLVGSAFAVTLALARSNGSSGVAQTPGPPTGSLTPPAQNTQTRQPTPAAVSLVTLWDNMCVRNVPYVLISVPKDAQLALVQPQGTMVPGSIQPATTPTVLPAATTFVGKQGTALPGPTATRTPAGTPTAQTIIGTMLPGQLACTKLGVLNGEQLILCTGPQAYGYTFVARSDKGSQTYTGVLWDCGAKRLPAGSRTPGAEPPSKSTPTGPVATGPAATGPAPTEPPATGPAPTKPAPTSPPATP